MLQKTSTCIRWLLVVVGVYVVFHLLSGFYAILSGGSFTDLIWVFAGELHQDSEHRTNFLLLGTGGGEHEGSDLTDTILVASYHHDLQTLAMFSIPRDFWAEAGDTYGMRINRIYEYEKLRLKDGEAALESVAKTASKIANLPIHYYAKVDFEGFRDLIDTLDGIKILIEESIEDPFYPCENLIDFCPFEISVGTQVLDGETALKFVRSRKTTSDFDRASRQQKVLEAIREKAFEKDILVNPRKLKQLWDIFEERVETNLRFREILRMGKIADEFNKQNIAQIVLNDEPTFVGGILYAPNREDYNGAAVLLPNGDNYRGIHALTNILLSHPRVAIDQIAIEVLNGSGLPRTAERVAYALNRYGFNTARINNYPGGELAKTTLYFYDELVAAETAEMLLTFFDAEVEPGPVELRKRGFDLTLVLGEDWVEIE